MTMLSVSEEYAQAMEQHGKTNVTLREIVEAFYKAQAKSDEQIAMDVINMIRHAPMELPTEPNFILGPAR